METEWAENRAKLPQDIIRRTVGKIIDFAYSTGEQDQYRVRLERNDDDTTDIYISHRSMVEVMTGRDNESSVWQPGPTDPTMEAEMLQRLALRIDAEFNPRPPVKSRKLTRSRSPRIWKSSLLPRQPLKTAATARGLPQWCSTKGLIRLGAASVW